MVEVAGAGELGGSGGGAGGGRPAERGATSFEDVAGRQRFTIELRPGETTIVSWKKLIKDAGVSKPNGAAGGSGAKSVASAQVNSSNPHSSTHLPHPSLDARFPPGQLGENEGKDAAQPPNRLNTVIERIERLYVGKASSDEEDLNDVFPDDDEYDTEDSFIDDTELDDYFQVDNSAIKHDGFFVNRGKLERIEPSQLPNEQPKKRRRKDHSKSLDGSESGQNPNKLPKVGKKAGKAVSLVDRDMHSLTPVIALPNVHAEDSRILNQMNATEISVKKKSTDSKTAGKPVLGPMNGNIIEQEKGIDLQKSGVLPSSNNGNVGGMDQCIQRRENVNVRERSEVHIADNKNSIPNMKTPVIPKKEGSNVRPKGTMLDKAIRDLEKLVAESRPPTTEVQDADNSSQGIKRRLPPEIKQKLAKVARLAQASHGKISKELVNRLMSIVGHLIQLRTLKRNLKIMVNMGLSAKQEKDSRVQLVKKEVAEMIKTRIPLMKSKALELQGAASDDFQDISVQEKEAFKRKYSMDDLLEEKICDLYDLYVEGLEEDAGPQVRKLYAELSALWPNGFMDNNGIKHAIYRAKDRRRASYSRHKDPEKIKRKKMLAQKAGGNVRVENKANAQPYIPEKLVTDSTVHGLAPVNKPNSSSAAASVAARMGTSFVNGSSVDRLKQDKTKGSPSNSADIQQAKEVSSMKKLRRKLEAMPGEPQFHQEKVLSVQGDEKYKPQKQVVASSLSRSNLQPAAPSSFEQHS